MSSTFRKPVGRKSVASALVALSVLMPVAQARAQGIPAARLDTARETTTARFALHWPGAVTTSAEQTGRELVLRFSRPLGGVALDSVPDRLASWVDNILYGYDSVVLVLAADVNAAVTPDSDGAAVSFERAPPQAPPPALVAADRAAQRRIEYFRALAMMESGQAREARALLRDLLERNPDDAQSTALLGQAEERIGRWRHALRAYDTALELTPNEPSLVESKARLLREHGDRVRLDVDWQRVRNADTQRIAKLSGMRELGGATSLMWALERRQVDVNAVQRADGTLTGFHGAREKLEVALAHDWAEQERSVLTVYVASRTVGAGYAHGWKGEESETRAGFALNEPNFAFLEGIVGAGRRDRVFVQHEQRLSDRWSMALGAGYNRYGLAGDSDLARSATMEGALRHSLDIEGPPVTVAYVLDAEYVGRREGRTNAQGQFYVPLPAATREVHILQVSVEDYIADYVRYSVQVGYAYDRRGSSGPQASVTIAWEPMDDLEVGLRASHARSTARGTASAVDSVGGYALWRY